MTFSTHDRTLLFVLMTSFAVKMEGFAQSRPVAGAFFSMTLSASLIFRRFIGQSLSIFVYMMTFIAFLNLSGFIVIIMPKNSRRSPLVLKAITVDHLHIFLGKCR
jgi:hypothetical protein